MESMNFFLLGVGILIGVVFAVLGMRLRTPTKHDDVFNLTSEQRAERDEGAIAGAIDYISTERLENFEKERKEYPVSPADAFPSLSEHAKAMYPPASADSYPDLKDPEYAQKMEERNRLYAEQMQKEMEEKSMAQREKDRLRDAEIEEERILKEEAARIKTDLKKWLY